MPEVPPVTKMVLPVVFMGLLSLPVGCGHKRTVVRLWVTIADSCPFKQERTMPEAADTRVRADALRNRERILKVALEELSRSADVPLSTIAKKAGVGQGTFYRHFPNRDALVMEVYSYEMLQVAKFAEHLLQTRPPDQALREWMNRFAEYA